ncbi:hypothetical protein I4U23_022547 [Adineta vaga]|nr:hypothetical protein I4U23_022547 [Adineta vaga]
MSSVSEHSVSPSISDYNSDVSLNQNRNTQISNITENISFSNDFIQLLSNLLYNSMFQTSNDTETQSTRIFREKGNVEWFNLIYLHSSPPDPSIIQKIRRLINIVKIFDDADECIACINSLTNQKLILILSDDFGDLFLPRIKDDLQISSIYVLSENPNMNSTFSSNQIRGVYRSIDEIYEMLSDDINPMKYDAVIFESVNMTNTKLNTKVLFFRLLYNALSDPNETKSAFQELVHFARQEYEGNLYELAQIEEFERNYKSTHAISWLLRPCFLLKMLHRALFLHEIDILFKFRGFLQDLNVALTKENQSEPISIYLGKTIEQSEIDSIESFRENGNLVTFQHLLFASTDRSQAIVRAKNLTRRSDEFLNLLIRIDFPSPTGYLTRFDQHLSSHDDGINLLISPIVMTKIIAIDKDYQKNGYILIHLQCVSLGDEPDFIEHFETIQNEIESTSPLLQLAKLSFKFNYQWTAEQFFSNLLNEDILIDDIKRQTSIAQGLELLAVNHFQLENFKHASELFLLCLKAYHRFLSKDDTVLYLTYRDLGESFYRIAEYQLAIDNFQLAFETQLHSNTPSLLYSAYCYYRLGSVYFKQGNDQNAIQALDRAEKILKQSDEVHHTELISIYETLAEYYINKENYDNGVIYYKKIIVVHQSIQPHDSKELHLAHFIIASYYLKKLDYSNAMIYYERAFDYSKEYLPEKHHTFVLLHNNIGYTYYKQEKYSNALYHYSNGLLLASECLPENSTLIGTLLSNTALVYSNVGRFDEAIETMEKAIAQLQKALSDEHEEVIYKRTLLDGIKRKKLLYSVIGEISDYF